MTNKQRERKECFLFRAVGISPFIPSQSRAFGLFLSSQSSLLQTAYEPFSRVRVKGHISPTFIQQMSSDRTESALHVTEQRPGRLSLTALPPTDQWECEMISWWALWTTLAARALVACVINFDSFVKTKREVLAVTVCSCVGQIWQIVLSRARGKKRKCVGLYVCKSVM